MAKANRRRTADPSPQSAPVVDTPWYRKAWPWLTGAAVLIGWVLWNGLTAISTAEQLPSAVSRLYEKVSAWYRTDQAWTGKWTNEGDVDARNQPSIYVDLDLLVQDRGVQGTISSGPQRDAIPLQFVLVEGAVTGNTLDALAFDYFQGVPKRIATFKISRVEAKGADQIKVATTWQAQPWFPKETVLWRAGETELLAQRRDHGG